MSVFETKDWQKPALCEWRFRMGTCKPLPFISSQSVDQAHFSLKKHLSKVADKGMTIIFMFLFN